MRADANNNRDLTCYIFGGIIIAGIGGAGHWAIRNYLNYSSDLSNISFAAGAGVAVLAIALPVLIYCCKTYGESGRRLGRVQLQGDSPLLAAAGDRTAGLTAITVDGAGAEGAQTARQTTAAKVDDDTNARPTMPNALGYQAAS